MYSMFGRLLKYEDRFMTGAIAGARFVRRQSRNRVSAILEFKFFKGEGRKSDIGILRIAGTDGIVRHAMLKHSRQVSQPRCAAVGSQNLEADTRGSKVVQMYRRGPAEGVDQVCQISTMAPPTMSVCVSAG